MKTHFNISFLEEATETLRAIAHPIRIAIIDMLAKSNQLSVSEIHEQLNIEQAVASHHLRILKGKKIVSVSREGKNSFYKLTNRDYNSIIQILTKSV
ncbi:MAG TPA: ArsR family transcriptional regulator [Saprospiraceae bacterium]|nr:ArsR family transcriptional regulator [Saprospiraceae bacterium]